MNSAKDMVHDEVRQQIGALSLVRSRPLIITDADEVLLQFVCALEAYLGERDLYLDLTSFALTGNIKHKDTREPLTSDAVREVVREFHEHGTDDVDPVAGAAEALACLATRAQIVVVSNVPFHRAKARQRNLRRYGMDYPVVANSGPKGSAVGLMARSVRAPIFFLDDIPRNLSSVAEHAAEVIRVRLICKIASPRRRRVTFCSCDEICVTRAPSERLRSNSCCTPEFTVSNSRSPTVRRLSVRSWSAL